MDDQSRDSLLTDVLQVFGFSDDAIAELVLHVEELRAGSAPPAFDNAPYRVRDHFLSPSEHRFFLILRQATDGWAEAYPKVGLGSLFYSKIGSHAQFQVDSHLLNRAQVDFLLCRPETLRPVLGIMLDVKTGHRKPQQRHGQFTDKVFAAAHVPLLHIAAERAYDVSALSELLARETGLAKKGPAAQPAQSTPRCPNCGSPMMLSAEQGGELLWTCPNFPCCRTVLRYETALNEARV